MMDGGATVYFTFADRSTTIARAKIAYVREALDDHRSLSMNPFFRGYSPKELSAAFNAFGDDAKTAATFLANNTDVDLFDVRAADIKGYMYARQFYLAERTGKNAEMMLSGVFQKRIMQTYSTLIDLEKAELATGHCDEIRAAAAMKVLSSVYVLARAVPAVYQAEKSPALER